MITRTAKGFDFYSNYENYFDFDCFPERGVRIVATWDSAKQSGYWTKCQDKDPGSMIADWKVLDEGSGLDREAFAAYIGCSPEELP